MDKKKTGIGTHSAYRCLVTDCMYHLGHPYNHIYVFVYGTHMCTYTYNKVLANTFDYAGEFFFSEFFVFVFISLSARCNFPFGVKAYTHTHAYINTQFVYPVMVFVCLFMQTVRERE